jgi:hypothetical protein
MARNTATSNDLDQDVLNDLEGALEEELTKRDTTSGIDIAACTLSIDFSAGFGRPALLAPNAS